MNTISISNLSVETPSEFTWFSLQEKAWHYFHYISISYMMPIASLLGLIENITIICVLYRLKSGIGQTVKTYYMLLSIFSIGNIITLHILNIWVSTGLKFLTQKKFYLSILDENIWVCRVYYNLFIPFAFLIDWIYVLLNIERVFAIASPLTAKSKFTQRRNLTYVGFFALLSIPLWIYFMWNTNIENTPMLIGPVLCLSQSPDVTSTIIFMVVLNVTMSTVPPILTLILGLILLSFIRRQQSVRANLVSASSRSADAPSSAAIAGGIVVITMAIVHSLINLPNGLVGFVFFVCAFSLFYYLIII